MHVFSFCAAQDVLDNFRGRFIECVEALKIVFDLEKENIIADGDLTEIRTNSDAKQQNEILHRHLRLSCDEKALMEVCDMIIAVRGNRRMNALGNDMKHQLEKFGEVFDNVKCILACVHLWVWLVWVGVFDVAVFCLRYVFAHTRRPQS